MHPKDIEPVEEVLAEGAGRHGRLEVAVGGGEHAHVHRNRVAAADAVNFPPRQRSYPVAGLARVRMVKCCDTHHLVEIDAVSVQRRVDHVIPQYGRSAGCQLALETPKGVRAAETMIMESYPGMSGSRSSRLRRLGARLA